MKLNKKKSGIVIFAPRTAHQIPYMQLKIKRNAKGRIEQKEWVPATKELEGIPIVSKYKYLGTHLDSKLTLKTQLDFIKKKANFLFVKLYPYLTNASANARKDMWRTMVCPLFNALLVLIYFEKAKTHNESMLRLWRSTFKRFMLIPKCTKTDLVDEMIGIDINMIKEVNAQNSARKWYARCHRTRPELLPREDSKDYLRGIPKEWCEILKYEFSICPLCKKSIRNAIHMEIEHRILIPSYKLVWESIKETYEFETEKLRKKNKIMKVKRRVFLEKWKPILKKIKGTIQERFNSVFNSKNL